MLKTGSTKDWITEPNDLTQLSKHSNNGSSLLSVLAKVLQCALIIVITRSGYSLKSGEADRTLKQS